MLAQNFSLHVYRHTGENEMRDAAKRNNQEMDTSRWNPFEHEAGRITYPGQGGAYPKVDVKALEREQQKEWEALRSELLAEQLKMKHEEEMNQMRDLLLKPHEAKENERDDMMLDQLKATRQGHEDEMRTMHQLHAEEMKSLRSQLEKLNELVENMSKELQMCEFRTQAGMRLLRQIISRQGRLEVRRRMDIWRTAVWDQVRAMVGDPAGSQAIDVAAQAIDVSKAAGLRQLKQIVARIMKGIVGMRLEIWRMAVKIDAAAKQEESQAELLQRIHDERQATALNNLKTTFARMVKGEVGMRVAVWRSQVRQQLRQDSRDRDMEQVQKALDMAMALREMRHFIGSMMQGEVAWAVQPIWARPRPLVKPYSPRPVSAEDGVASLIPKLKAWPMPID